MNPTNKFLKVKDIYPLLKNPQKYNGKLPITLRSSWEVVFVLKFLDKHESVLEWSSESFFIPYFNPIDKKIHKYFPDFYAKIKDKNGKIERYIIEIKPKADIVLKQKNGVKQTKKLMEQVKTITINQAKFESAQKYAQENGIKFLVLTEDELPVR